ncbi:hypothetical protein U6N30_27595 [Blastococcus brunescens]|uniref:Transcriptional regulator n=1 Tax=Blastococcus brunescens TaxID=1564165 RepID=A0ABZ1BAX9_9ACTN|nr:hypothetical protein [Blastococcus sp. BMG 8361]WRL67313.1 hypothetical protein U6N30_27595 [Blastococcus sp. BMG 8361]
MCYACPVEALAALADPVRRELVGLLAQGSWPPESSPTGSPSAARR